MKESTQVHYLEIVTTDVEQVCASYSKTLGVSFSDAVAELGGARTTALSEGGTLGIRAPMHVCNYNVQPHPKWFLASLINVT